MRNIERKVYSQGRYSDDEHAAKHMEMLPIRQKVDNQDEKYVLWFRRDGVPHYVPVSFL